MGYGKSKAKKPGMISKHKKMAKARESGGGRGLSKVGKTIKHKKGL
jgi:hypothetical protein